MVVPVMQWYVALNAVGAWCIWGGGLVGWRGGEGRRGRRPQGACPPVHPQVTLADIDVPLVRKMLGISDSVTAVPQGLTTAFTRAADSSGAIAHVPFTSVLRTLVESCAGTSLAAPASVPLRRLFSVVAEGLFSAFDANHDGFVSAAELQRGLHHLCRPHGECAGGWEGLCVWGGGWPNVSPLPSCVSHHVPTQWSLPLVPRPLAPLPSKSLLVTRAHPVYVRRLGHGPHAVPRGGLLGGRSGVP